MWPSGAATVWGARDSDRPRAIIAKFVGHNDKVELLKHKANLKELMEKDEEIKEMAEDLNIGIFMNEDLTNTRAGWTQGTPSEKKTTKKKKKSRTHGRAMEFTFLKSVRRESSG